MRAVKDSCEALHAGPSKSSDFVERERSMPSSSESSSSSSSDSRRKRKRERKEKKRERKRDKKERKHEKKRRKRDKHDQPPGPSKLPLVTADAAARRSQPPTAADEFRVGDAVLYAAREASPRHTRPRCEIHTLRLLR